MIIRKETENDFDRIYDLVKVAFQPPQQESPSSEAVGRQVGEECVICNRLTFFTL